jgi:hypothetical protein
VLWRVERPIAEVGQSVRQDVMLVEERARAQPASGMTFALLESRRSSVGSTLMRRCCVAILYASWCTRVGWENRKMITILIVILIVLLIGALPTWPYSSGWGYYPGGVLGAILVIVLILALLGRI